MPTVAAIQSKIDKLTAQLQAAKSREAKRIRARETRKKIVLGAAILKLVDAGKLPENIINNAVAAMSNRDKVLFENTTIDPEQPNAITLAAIEEVMSGNCLHAENLDDLFNQLEAE